MVLTTVKIINYLFSMNNCSIKASKSYKNLTNFYLELLWIPTRWVAGQFGSFAVTFYGSQIVPSQTRRKEGKEKSDKNGAKKRTKTIYWHLVCFKEDLFQNKNKTAKTGLKRTFQLTKLIDSYFYCLRSLANVLLTHQWNIINNLINWWQFG